MTNRGLTLILALQRHQCNRVISYPFVSHSFCLNAPSSKGTNSCVRPVKANTLAQAATDYRVLTIYNRVYLPNFSPLPFVSCRCLLRPEGMEAEAASLISFSLLELVLRLLRVEIGMQSAMPLTLREALWILFALHVPNAQ